VIIFSSYLCYKFHGCGHDGHTAIIAGLAPFLSSLRIKYENDTSLNADVVLLFQPAEETGAGALSMVRDERYASFENGIMTRVNAAFALHNLPGYDRSTVLVKKGTFASASKGVRIELRGETSHAAQPEFGRSPASALASIIKDLEQLAQLGRERKLPRYKDFILLTVVHAHLGTEQVAYGVTPGEARVMVTVRSYLDEDMDVLIQDVRKIVKDACIEKGIEHEITFSDEFFATRNEEESTPNDQSLIEMVRQAAVENNLKIQDMSEPFRWSEDFGNFQFKGSTYFGLGSGKSHPSLHNDDYDFPDDLLEPGLRMFARLAEQLIMSPQ
jgi:amidohydrolase